jgi:hypothetical protein
VAPSHRQLSLQRLSVCFRLSCSTRRLVDVAPQFYALRKQTVLSFRQFSLRGLDKVRGEWSLVTLAWNIKRMFALKPAAKPQIAPSRAIQAPPTASPRQGNTRKPRVD